MAVPLTLSSVPAVLPYIQYVATGGQTVFPYPFPITQDSDLVVVINGVTQNVDSTYSLSGQGNATGGNVTFNAGQAANTIITLFRNVTIQRVTQIAQNSGFSSITFNAEFNQIYLILQQLSESISLSLQIPNTNNPAPVTTLSPLLYAGKTIIFDQYGNPQPGILTATAVTAAVLQSLLFPQTTAELAAGITPGPYAYGDIRRYGIFPGSSFANANTVAIKALFNPLLLNGPSGLFTFFNSGTVSGSAPDTYYFNDMWQVRDNVHLDLNGCTLDFTKTGVNSDSQNSFIFALRNFTIENGTLNVHNYVPSGAFVAGAALGFGARSSPVSGSPLPTVYDSLLSAPMGNIVVRNIKINSTVASNGNGVLMFGGLRNVLFQNVEVAGNAALTFGFYAEFGFATHGVSLSQSQTSHPHDIRFENCYVHDLATGASSYAVSMNGAYGVTIDGIMVSAAAGIASFGPGEGLFFNPWTGQDDIGTLTQSGTGGARRWIRLRNIKGRALTGTAVSVQGALTPTNVQGIASWLPSTGYLIGAVVYNGSNKYTCASNGTSTTGAGPTGTGSGIGDGTTSWNYTAAFSSNGYLGWAANTAYLASDIVFNGHYYYTCTTPGTSGSAQGPIGTGTNIADGATVKWSSVGTAWPLLTDLLNLEVDGVEIDGINGTGGYGIRSSCGIVDIRDYVITNFQRGVVTETDTGTYNIEGGTILNSASIGIQIGLSNQVYAPARLTTGTITRNKIAGGATQGIAIANAQKALIDFNTFGYELITDGIAETTQQQAVLIDATCSNIVCRKNYVAAVSAGNAYQQSGVASSQGCIIDGMQGPVQTYSTWWEGVEQAWTPVLTCVTPGNLAVSYSVQAGGYIKRDHIIEYWYNVVTSAFTHTAGESGNVELTGLPYASNTTANNVHAGALTFGGVTKASYTQVTSAIAAGTAIVTFFASGSGQASGRLQIADMPTAANVVLQGASQYFV